METVETPFTPPFQEAEWLKMIFLLSDTQNWLNELVGNTFLQVPIGNKKSYSTKPITLPLQHWHTYWKSITTK